jgi:hypothetical protein
MAHVGRLRSEYAEIMLETERGGRFNFNVTSQWDESP